MRRSAGFQILLASGAVLLAAPTVRAAHVDFFDAGDFSLTAAPGETNTASQTVPPGPTGALGGERTVTLTNDALSTGNLSASLTTDTTDDAPDADNDAVNFALEADSTGSAFFEYANFNERDFINIPAMDAKWDRVVVDFVGQSSASADAGVTVTLTSGDGQTASVTKTADGDGRLSFLHDEFFAANAGFTTDSLLDVDSGSLLINGTAGSSYNVEFFGRGGFVPNQTTVIPLPSALLAMPAMMGMAGVAYRRMRRRV